MYRLTMHIAGLISAWFAIALIPAMAAPASSEPTPMVIKYHYNPVNDAHLSYNLELIHRILEVTRADFGDYKIEPYSQAPNAKRQAQLLTEGQLMNVHWAPPGTDIARADVIPVPIDILQGLQGYRVCLINADAEVDFSQIKDVESLRKLRIAQGAAWDEIPIYHFNGIVPLEGPILGGLYPMLGLKRYDCLPLGVNEINNIFNMQRKEYPFLAIDDKLLIHYEFPIYFYVSKNHPEIAERFSVGLKRLKASGEFDHLFRRYHQKNISALKLSERKIVCLKSPLIPKLHQCDPPLELPAILSH